MKLNTKQTVLIGFAFMAILCFWQFYDQVIPHILENVFSVSTLATNAIMALDNILALVLLPFFGALSDRTKTPLGRRTPYILFGTLGACILLVCLAYTEAIRSFSGFLFCLVLLLLVMSTYRSAAVAYMPDVTPKPLRSKANAIINFVGYIGGIFATLMMMLLLKSESGTDGASSYLASQSFTPIFLVIAGFMLISVLIMTVSVRENQAVKAANVVPEIETDRDHGKAPIPKDVLTSLILLLFSVFFWYMAYNAVTTAFSRYCYTVWGVDLSVSSGYLMAATIVAIASFLPLGFLSSKVGRKKAILFGVLLMTICYSVGFFLQKPSVILYLLFGLVGIGWAAINVNSYPMVVELGSSEKIGKYTGYYYAASMAAQILTPLLSGLLIQVFPIGYQILFPYAAFFSILAFFTMSRVRHGDTKVNEAPDERSPSWTHR